MRIINPLDREHQDMKLPLQVIAASADRVTATKG
jgi:hypothetical protein